MICKIKFWDNVKRVFQEYLTIRLAIILFKRFSPSPPHIEYKHLQKKLDPRQTHALNISPVCKTVSQKTIQFLCVLYLSAGRLVFPSVQLERQHTKSQFLFNFIISLFIIDWVRGFLILTIGKARSCDCCAEAVQTSFLSTHEHLYCSVQYFCIAYL